MADFEIKHYHEYVAPLIEDCTSKECTDYCIAIGRGSEEGIEDTVKKDILTLFCDVFSYLLKSDSPKKPFSPFWEGWEERRSALPSDLSQKQRQFLERVLPEIDDCEARARVADVLWTLGYGRRHEHAETAIEAYLLSAERLLQYHPGYIEGRVERAFRIAKQLSSRNSKYNDVRGKIEHYIETQKDDGPFLVKGLIDLLFKEKEADSEKHSAVLKDIAEKMTRKEDFSRLDEFWDLAAKLDRKTNEKAKYCQIQAAETYVAMAEGVP
jgi:hypothetical protein